LCAMCGGRQVITWGDGYYAQLGNGTQNQSGFAFARLTFPENTANVVAGYWNSAVITVSGNAYAWGYNQYGEVPGKGAGANVTTPSLLPQPADAGKWASIAFGPYHFVGVTSKGSVYTSGLNDMGQLGNGTQQNSTSLVRVVNEDGTFVTDAVTATAGNKHSCVLTSSKTVRCWGSNAAGQLGNNGKSNSYKATLVVDSGVKTLRAVHQVVAGSDHTMAVTQDGKVWGFGLNTSGQLGNGTTSNLAYANASKFPLIDPLGKVLAAASNTTYVLDRNAGQVWAAGSDVYGMLGDKAGQTNSPSPVAVAMPTDHWVDGIGAGANAAIFSSSFGPNRTGNYSWFVGYNGYGQNGIATGANSETPSQAFDLRTFPCSANASDVKRFSPTVFGCAGKVTFANRASLCKGGATVVPAKDWTAYQAGASPVAPSYSYWTDTLLKYSGNGANACYVSQSVGSDCGSTTPMRVVPQAASPDGLGNTYNWYGCGDGANVPNRYYGGCAGSLYAGTLCAPGAQ